MVRAIRQVVVVQETGLVQLREPSLHVGDRAEVIVLRNAAVHDIADADAFFANRSLDELAAEQGIGGAVPFEQRLGGWPQAERDDGFERAVVGWRRGGVAARRRNR